jgi:hypothetical protein
LAGANFSDAEILSADPREQQELIVGVWLFELAGLRKIDVERITAPDQPTPALALTDPAALATLYGKRLR